MSTCVQDEFASIFKDMSPEEPEECARSFRFDECVQREELNKALEEHAVVEEIGRDFVRPTNDRPDLGNFDFAREQGD